MKYQLRAPMLVLGTSLAMSLVTGCQDESASPITGPAPRVASSEAAADIPDPMNADPPVRAAAAGGVFISNGVIQLGVNRQGHLNVDGGVRSISGTTAVGLRYLPTNADATAAGCQCEGWGVADVNTGVRGFANVAVDGVNNLVVEDFTVTPTEARSTVRVGTTFRVSHHYKPSTLTPDLYEVRVRIDNISAANVRVRYRRVMDWDIEPTPFSEFVTIQKGTSPDLFRTDNNGFNSANPFSFSSFGSTGSFVDVGPRDHGALFDFDFGILEPGRTKEFLTYYGASSDEARALAALGAVSAEAYSLGQTRTDPIGGRPNTFMFAFAGIGGTVPPELPPAVNAEPVASVGGPYAGAEAGPVSLSLSGSDADAGDVLSYKWDLGDGTTGSGAVPPTSHTYDDNGTYTITLTVTDGKGGTDTESTTASIVNVNPTGTLVSPVSINEGESISLSVVDGNDVSGADVAAGFTYAFNCGNGYGAFSSTSSAACPATTDNGSVEVKAVIRDKDGGVAEAIKRVTVANVAPVLGPIAASTAPSPVNTSVSVSAAVSDAGSADTHTALIQWGDGTTSTVNAVSGSVGGSHNYTAAGVYTVAITATDDDGGVSNRVTFEYIVIYDPSAGFVTGGGWIMSPSGAFAADPSLSGKATFGFVSKYQKGATAPTGNTEFQFHAGSLVFKSTSYQWLVISGPKAQYKGEGTVNGVAGYKFLLTANDGQVSGGGGTDRFRIKITDSSDNLVYDNQPGDTETAGASTALGGGSIVIHSK